MSKNENIILLSLPFLAGLTIAAFALQWLKTGQGLALAAAVACLIAGAAKQGRSGITMAALFFFLGIFCREAAEIFPEQVFYDVLFSNKSDISLSRKALQGLSAIIESIPFRGSETGPLLRALLTGQKDLLGRDTIDTFRIAGAAHILALSGLHMGVIYMILNKFLGILGNSIWAGAVRSVSIVLLSGFYVLMTGSSPSIVRAFIFIVLGEIARHFKGRRKTPLSVWCTALLLQLAIKPKVINSVSFQLSYLAMLGIFLLYPSLKNLYPASTGRASHPNLMRFIWNSMALSISCQVFTGPVAWIHFHSFPKYFLLANLLALPLTEALMIAAVPCIALSSIKICPHFLMEAVDYIASGLLWVLRIISKI
ncbi:MAG: ComEC/Rec2 family competence protein [Rikenellaceae bacterium]|nr:ComEC/Rec2 family competence protein [Rikenellaceae bacterium]